MDDPLRPKRPQNPAPQPHSATRGAHDVIHFPGRAQPPLCQGSDDSRSGTTRFTQSEPPRTQTHAMKHTNTFILNQRGVHPDGTKGCYEVSNEKKFYEGEYERETAHKKKVLAVGPLTKNMNADAREALARVVLRFMGDFVNALSKYATPPHKHGRKSKTSKKAKAPEAKAPEAKAPEAKAPQRQRHQRGKGTRGLPQEDRKGIGDYIFGWKQPNQVG